MHTIKSVTLAAVSVMVVFISVQCNSTSGKEEINKENNNSQAQKNASTEQSSTVESTAASDGKKDAQNDIKVTFIELGSVNCIPCKMMQPVMKDIEKDYGKQVKVVFHDVWTPEGKPYGAEFGIQSIPTQVFLDKDGKEYYRHVGFFPKEELIKILQMNGVK
jgi:thiol-disulfide isomerase/thioredoxin